MYVSSFVLVTDTASSKSFASSPSIVNISSFLKSFLPAISSKDISFSIFLASSITNLGNSYGNLYSFIIESISTPAIFMLPNISIIFPSGFFPSISGLVI